MTRFYRVTAALVVVLLLVGPTLGVADAQEVTTTASTPSTPTTNDTERIDSATVLLSSDWDNETGMASVTIRCEIPQSLVLADLGGAFEGGVVDTRRASCLAGQTATYEVPATNVSGFVGVSISTKQVLYSEPISGLQTGAGPSVPDSTWGSVVLGSGAAFVATVVLVTAVIWFRARQDDDDTEREVLAQ